MKLRTEISIHKAAFRISHSDKILLIGSCFAENTGNRLEASCFQADVNPFGVLYNPLSVASGLEDLLQERIFSGEDIFEYRGLYSSLSHHSRFSALTKQACLEKINSRMAFSSSFLKEANVLMVTFGTARAYRLKENGMAVSNCHKLPAGRFFQERLDVREIVETWSALTERLKKHFPALEILLTVSPIRHWKDGAHENQLSKSVLLLAIEELQKKNGFIHYFPSYELLLDDLRDYRFYAEDLLHPSAIAMDYIWEKFSDAYFDEKTKAVIKECNLIRRDLEHRPFNPESPEFKIFKADAEKRWMAFNEGLI
jgi:hypothetical protein